MGYVRVEKGANALALEMQCAWAVPLAVTTVNTPCYEDGSNCINVYIHVSVIWLETYMWMP